MAKKPILPMHDKAKAEDLLKEYLEGYRVDKDVNLPRKREMELEELRKGVSHKYVKDNRFKFYGAKTADEKKDILAEMLGGIIQEGYDAYGKGVPLTDETLNYYVADALRRFGISSYDQLIQHMANEEDLDADDKQGVLYHLINHVAQSQHKDAKKLQTIRRTLENKVEHWSAVKDTLGKLTGIEYNPAATGTDVMADHDEYIQQKILGRRYQRPKTYTGGTKREAA